MSKNTPKAIKYGIIFVLILLGVGYVLFNSRIFIEGPQVSISSPTNGSMSTEKKVQVVGNTFNTSFVSINDRSISIDEQGNFNVPVLLQEGYNQVVIKAHDKFDRQVTQTLDLVYNRRSQLE